MAQAVLGVALALALALSSPAAFADKNNPAWSELRPSQQRVLAPIRSEWDALDAHGKLKWVGIADRYPKMSPDAQARLQRQMKEWAALTPEQRRAARDKYREFEQLGPEEVRLKWDQYTQEQAAKEAAAKAIESEKAASAVESATTERGAEAPSQPQ
ncbi:MAG: DUF3106 domain-containing protein [Burkholderiales bacterium]